MSALTEPLLRKAAPPDAQEAAHLVLQAAPSLVAICSGWDSALRAAAEAFRQPRSAFGYEFTEIADLAGAPEACAGLIIAVPEEHWSLARRGLAGAVARVLGWRVLTLLPAAPFLTRMDLPLPRGSLHISIVAVQPGHRGKGLGSILIQGVVERARRQGRSAVTLDVDVDNPRARDLYLRQGFAAVARKVLPPRLARRLGTAGFERMELRLPGRPAGLGDPAQATLRPPM